MRDVSSPPREDDTTTAIPDVRDLPVDAILLSDDSALSNVVRWLVSEMAEPGEPYAGFSNVP